jgi:DNA primase
MSGRIPRYFIDDLLARVDIVDLIDSHVPLKKTGANFVARCPFHTEKTPSFSVSRNKQLFHCFGCGVSGNAIGFLMDFSHLDFVEAVEDLATFAGVEVPRETSDHSNSAPKKENISDQYQLLEQVAAFYVECLRTHDAGKKAVAYLKARGVTDDCARAFMIGYAPDEWQALANRFDQNQLIQTGLLIDKDGRTYDRFRGRVMYPIRDKRGRIVGFGGRVLDDSLPKYLNSPETSVFQKGKEVYGLFELLRNDSKPKRILIVEGYMDVIALVGSGIHYVVATLGTATSQAHLDLLFRFSSELVFCFDGDNAGQMAAWRAISSVFPSLKAGRQIRIMILPEKHDPDSLIKEEGNDQFVERIKTSQALSEYFFENLTKDLKLAEKENRSNLIEEAKGYLNKLPVDSFRELMFDELSKLNQRHVLDHEAILAYKNQEKKHRQRTDRLSLPSFVMALLVQNPRLVEIIEQRNVDWNSLEFDGIEKFKDILQMILNNKPANYGVLVESYRGHIDEPIINKLAVWDLLVPDDGLKKEFSDALDNLFDQARTTRLEKLLAKDKNIGLDQPEKELLRKLLGNKHSGAI